MEPSLSTLEAHVVRAVDREALVSDVQRLVRIESSGGAETPAQEVVAERMSEVGLAVDRWGLDLKAVQSHEHASWEIERDSALGVIGRLQGTGTGPTLVLNGHVDVVPAGDPRLWSHPPFGGTVEGGRIHGRGALDMKGPLLAGLHALGAILRSGVELEGTVRLDSVIGEEDGGLGTLATIGHAGPGDAAIVLEPTELAVVPLQAGCLNFRVRIEGRAAHGAVRDEGVSALDKLERVLSALRSLEAERSHLPPPDPLFGRYASPFPISVGTVRGGDWASSVPDQVTIEGRMGIRPDEAPAAARRALEDAVAAAASDDVWMVEHPPAVGWWGGRFLPVRTPADHELVRTLVTSATAVRGQAPRVEGVPFGSDAGLYATLGGVPTVLFGAGDIRDAHRPNESVAIDDLVEMAGILAVAALRYCGTAGREATAR